MFVVVRECRKKNVHREALFHNRSLTVLMRNLLAAYDQNMFLS
jgi:hypothetical protein